MKQSKSNDIKQASSSDVRPSHEDNKTASTKVQSKTVVVCAIDETELNKVEYAFFKRPLPPNNASVILSDK